MTSGKEFDDFSELTLDPTFKGAVLRRLDDILFYNRKNRLRKTYNVLENPLLVSPTVIYLRKNSYLTETLNEKLNLLKSNGIIDYWIGHYLGSQYLKIKDQTSHNKAMTLKALSGAFEVLLVGVVISCLAFVAELLSFMLEARNLM